MSGDCLLCEVASHCSYEHKPCACVGQRKFKAKSDSTDLLSAERSHDEIIAGWKRAVETYTFGGLTTEERHQFERMALMERQTKEKSFILP